MRLFKNLSARERIFVMVGAGVLAVMLVIVGIQKLRGAAAEAREDLARAQAQLVEMRGIAEEKKTGPMVPVKQTLASDNVLPEIENLLKNHNIREKAINLSDAKTTVEKKYTKTSVKIQLNDCPYTPFSEFLYDVEEHKQYDLFVEYYRMIKRPNKPGIYDFTLTIISLAELAKPGAPNPIPNGGAPP